MHPVQKPAEPVPELLQLVMQIHDLVQAQRDLIDNIGHCVDYLVGQSGVIHRIEQTTRETRADLRRQQLPIHRV